MDPSDDDESASARVVRWDKRMSTCAGKVERSILDFAPELDTDLSSAGRSIYCAYHEMDRLEAHFGNLLWQYRQIESRLLSKSSDDGPPELVLE